MATVGAVIGKVITAASRPTSDSPAPTLNRADTSGMAAAMNEPNMASSNSSAKLSPMISERRSSLVWPMLPALPPYSTCRPACRAGATAVFSRLR